MSRIDLTSSFTLIPEGTYIFYIYACNYDEAFGKMTVKMITADGYKYDERFSLKDDNDLPNEKAMNAFSFFAKTACNNFGLEYIDHSDLVGHYIQMQIIHNEVTSRKNGKTMTFANSGVKAVAEGFANEPIPSVAAMIGSKSPAPTTPPPTVTPIDLDALLG